ncbi:MAG: MBL fold metallo-hydrolase [Desulfitobacteriaceae bacterium]
MIYPVLLWDEDGATLVDTGFPGKFAQLKQAVEEADVPFDRIRRVIITHQDWDHIGNLPEIVREGNGVEIYTHVAEKPYIEGTLPLIKMSPERIAARLNALPPALRAEGEALFARKLTVRVDRVLQDGEILPYHGGIEILHTPGHTPGHICLFLLAHRLLIAGDQLRVEEGDLQGPAEMHTPDMPLARQSLKKLTGRDIAQIICYHGGVYGLNAVARLNKLAAQEK